MVATWSRKASKLGLTSLPWWVCSIWRAEVLRTLPVASMEAVVKVNCQQR